MNEHVMAGLAALIIAWLEYRSGKSSRTYETRIALLEHRVEKLEDSGKS